MRRLLGALALAAACAATPAGAGAQRPAFGIALNDVVLHGPLKLGHELTRMRAHGATQISAPLYWANAEPDGPPDQAPAKWASFDRIVAAAARRHLRVLPVVLMAPRWAALHPGRTFSPPADPAQYGAFVGRAVARYGREGTFWTDHPDLPQLPIRDWQIWNEPTYGSDGSGSGHSLFWDDDQWLDRYVAMLKASYPAAHTADPQARVLLGGLLGESWKTLGLLYGAGARGFFDGVALHPYTSHADRVDDIVRFCRKVLDSHGDSALRFVITETGFPAINGRRYDQLGRRRIAEQQRQWAQTALGELRREHKTLRLDGIFWYTWASRDKSPTRAFDYAGLTRLAKGGKSLVKSALKVFATQARKAASG